MTVSRRLRIIVDAVFLIGGFSELTLSSAFYAPYLLLAVAGAVCLAGNFQASTELFGKGMSRLAGWTVLVTSALLSLLVCVANHAIWDVGGLAEPFLLLGIGGCLVAFGNVLLLAISRGETLAWRPRTGSRRPLAVFLAVFLVTAIVDLSVLFLCKYPGNLTPDSISMWKDIPFGASVLLFAVFMYRVMSWMPLRPLNWAGLAISPTSRGSSSSEW